ncbi:unnamed protein product [Cyclocybe aegerita]|uniref:F-box domain-containing protein n=1 Tax=Cyclocybe aegerita TaxID=1973307 RepID=A0A8S0VX88_CYCAE|nr:unnamed protein product [Cyclocybe aegerita]
MYSSRNMHPELPLDILFTIFSHLPVSRSRLELGPRTLASCLQTNSQFRDAASLPLLWKPHYHIRYEHSDQKRERARRNAVQDNNWQLLYSERRRLDCKTMRLLDEVVSNRVTRQAQAELVVELAMDVWDALELESECPVPAPFADTEFENGSCIPDHAITRRFWAKSLLDTISRGHAVSIWRRFWEHSGGPSFEETMTPISCFLGCSEKRITAQLDDLANRCRKDLENKGIVVNSGDPGYNLASLCRGIWLFMREDGFSAPSKQEYQDILNNFPHASLTTKKRTIPISLAHIYAAIGTRLGIDVSPVNFPGTVLAHVLPREPGAEPLIINASASQPQQAVGNLSIADPVPAWNAMHGYSNIREFLVPCSGQLMLLRASNNILSSLMSVADVPRYVVRPAVLFAVTTHLLFQADERTLRRLMSEVKLQPLDCIFMRKELAPCLVERCAALLKAHIDFALEEEAADESNRRTPNGPKYFVGMGFYHILYGYFGFIWGWTKNCVATEEWIVHMKMTDPNDTSLFTLRAWNFLLNLEREWTAAREEEDCF